MTLAETVRLWNIQNKQDFWTPIKVHSAIDKEALVDYLLYEYADMQCVDSNSGAFRNHVKNFFDIHKWNIDKLADTLKLEYDPLENVRWHTDDVTQEDKDTTGILDNKATEDVITDHNMDWSESGTEDSEDVHYLSAFNDRPSPQGGKFFDVEKTRDTNHTDYSKGGDQVDKDIRDKDTTEHEDTFQNVDDHTDKDIDKFGHDGGSYQSLIEEERKQAQFNIYKWIGRHFSRELLICLW